MSVTVFVPVGPRPYTVQVTRQIPGPLNNMGEATWTSQTMYAALPVVISSRVIRGRIELSKNGLPVVQKVFLLFADGINCSGFTPSTYVTARGQQLLVDQNGIGAFPDIAQNDLVTDQDGRQFRVVSVQPYFKIYPTLHVEMEQGKG